VGRRAAGEKEQSRPRPRGQSVRAISACGVLSRANVACRDQSVRAVSACDCPGVRAVVAGEEETTPAGPARQGHVRLRGPVWDRGLLQQLGPECQGCRGSLPLLQRE
jgi:hypothetical protein